MSFSKKGINANATEFLNVYITERGTIEKVILVYPHQDKFAENGSSSLKYLVKI